ncbi:hypothetical protein [Nostoc sp. NMS7]|uniref:hypothetical protein n=1 Tax=Nostoc sp. NMS7 TaxID=2815391 RepID=UPI0025E5A573|nr:hypothetical protein [Nostoc sp. NMS7]
MVTEPFVLSAASGRERHYELLYETLRERHKERVCVLLRRTSYAPRLVESVITNYFKAFSMGTPDINFNQYSSSNNDEINCGIGRF